MKSSGCAITQKTFYHRGVFACWPSLLVYVCGIYSTVLDRVCAIEALVLYAECVTSLAFLSSTADQMLMPLLLGTVSGLYQFEFEGQSNEVANPPSQVDSE